MAVKTREEILELVRTRIGDQTDDDSISFLEDITDTLTDFEEKAKGDGEDWKTKYEENDREWRNKYKERFFSNEPNNNPNIEPNIDPNNEPPKVKTFEELFEYK